jgi:hypothetical protein
LTCARIGIRGQFSVGSDKFLGGVASEHVLQPGIAFCHGFCTKSRAKTRANPLRGPGSPVKRNVGLTLRAGKIEENENGNEQEKLAYFNRERLEKQY